MLNGVHSFNIVICGAVFICASDGQTDRRQGDLQHILCNFIFSYCYLWESIQIVWYCMSLEIAEVEYKVFMIINVIICLFHYWLPMSVPSDCEKRPKFVWCSSLVTLWSTVLKTLQWTRSRIQCKVLFYAFFISQSSSSCAMFSLKVGSRYRSWVIAIYS